VNFDELLQKEIDELGEEIDRFQVSIDERRKENRGDKSGHFNLSRLIKRRTV
jgi:hypothetical protein